MSQFITEYESRPINFSQIQDEEDDSVSVSYSLEEGDDELHQVRRLLEELGKLTFPLKPNGVTPAELEVRMSNFWDSDCFLRLTYKRNLVNSSMKPKSH